MANKSFGITGYRADINALRAIAVSIVVLYHAAVPGFSAGFIGVDLFFVVSGYLMTQIVVTKIERQQFSLLSFYWARCVRIIPALLVLVAAVWGLGFWLIEPVEFKSLSKHALASLTFLSNVAYWREAGYFDAASKTKWFLHTWSLSVEWQFYLVYPFVIMGIWRRLRSARARFVALSTLLVLSLLAAVIATQVLNIGKVSSFAFFMLPTRAWEMLAGGCVFLCAREGWKIPGLIGLPFAAVLAIASAIALRESTAWPSSWTVLPVVATMVFLLSDSKWTGFDALPLRALGRWSYSIYLWHWPLVVGAAYFDSSGALSILFVLVGSVLLGALSFEMVEKKSQGFLSSDLLHWKRSAPVLLATFLSIGASVVFDGFDWRVRGDAVKFADSVIASTDRTYPVERCGGLRFGVPRVCLAGDGKPATVAVIGDSFAEMWWGRFSDLAARNATGVAFYTAGGCPPVTGVSREGYGTDCAAVQAARLKAVIDDTRLHTVVIAGMWNSYFQPGRDSVRIQSKDGPSISANGEEGSDLVLHAIRSDIAALLAAKKTVVFATTAPYPGTDVPTQIRRAAFGGGVLPGASYDYSAKLADGFSIDDEIRSMSGDGVYVVDLQAYFCSGFTCPSQRNGRVIFSDSAHYRASFLQQLGESPFDRFIHR